MDDPFSDVIIGAADDGSYTTLGFEGGYAPSYPHHLPGDSAQIAASRRPTHIHDSFRPKESLSFQEFQVGAADSWFQVRRANTTQPEPGPTLVTEKAYTYESAQATLLETDVNTIRRVLAVDTPHAAIQFLKVFGWPHGATGGMSKDHVASICGQIPIFVDKMNERMHDYEPSTPMTAGPQTTNYLMFELDVSGPPRTRPEVADFKTPLDPLPLKSDLLPPPGHSSVDPKTKEWVDAHTATSGTQLFVLDPLANPWRDTSDVTAEPAPDPVTPDHTRVVTSDDLVWVPHPDSVCDKWIEENKRPFAMPGINIGILNEGERLHIQCFVVKGVGRFHAIHIPTDGMPYHKHVFDIRVPNVPLPFGMACELVGSCPRRVFDIEECVTITTDKGDGKASPLLSNPTDRLKAALKKGYRGVDKMFTVRASRSYACDGCGTSAPKCMQLSWMPELKAGDPKTEIQYEEDAVRQNEYNVSLTPSDHTRASRIAQETKRPVAAVLGELFSEKKKAAAQKAKPSSIPLDIDPRARKLLPFAHDPMRDREHLGNRRVLSIQVYTRHTERERAKFFVYSESDDAFLRPKALRIDKGVKGDPVKEAEATSQMRAYGRRLDHRRSMLTTNTSSFFFMGTTGSQCSTPASCHIQMLKLTIHFPRGKGKSRTQGAVVNLTNAGGATASRMGAMEIDVTVAAGAGKVLEDRMLNADPFELCVCSACEGFAYCHADTKRAWCTCAGYTKDTVIYSVRIPYVFVPMLHGINFCGSTVRLKAVPLDDKQTGPIRNYEVKEVVNLEKPTKKALSLDDWVEKKKDDGVI